MRTISITSATSRFSRSASSLMMVINSRSASGRDWPSRLVTAAFMEVRGVLKSCASASSSADFSTSLWRAASARLASSSVRARSIPMATRYATAFSTSSGRQGPGQPQIAQRPPAQAHGNDGQCPASIDERFVPVGLQFLVGNQRIVRPPAERLVRQLGVEGGVVTPRMRTTRLTRSWLAVRALPLSSRL